MRERRWFFVHCPKRTTRRRHKAIMIDVSIKRLARESLDGGFFTAHPCSPSRDNRNVKYSMDSKPSFALPNTPEPPRHSGG